MRLPCERDAEEEVSRGDVAFWPSGSMFCVFWGKTPVSTSDKPRAVSPVNVFGKINGDLQLLDSLKDGDIISVIVK